jgi:hypothetical protein
MFGNVGPMSGPTGWFETRPLRFAVKAAAGGCEGYPRLPGVLPIPEASDMPPFSQKHHPGDHGFSSPHLPGVGDPACQAEILLSHTGYPVLGRVHCDFRDGVLRLRGLLPSYYLKQIAQETVSGLPGVRSIRNELEVGTGVDDTQDGVSPPVAESERLVDALASR